MKPFLEGLAVSAFSLLLPAAALAQAGESTDRGPVADAPAAQAEQAPAPPPPGYDWEEQYPAEPDDAPVAQAEPPPAAAAPDVQAPAPGAPPPAAVQAVPPGQWVYTAQYGWVWMPYADAYTFVPPDGYGEPYMYVYTPVWGWSWLVAPWVWGFGPWPHFGVFGAVHFGWYHHGWWRTPERWHWVEAPGHGGFRHGGGFRPYPAPRGAPFRGVAPSPGRGGFDRGGGRVVPAPSRGGTRMDAPAPVFRGGPGGRGGVTYRSGGFRPGSGWSGGVASRPGSGWSGASAFRGGGTRAGWTGRAIGGGRSGFAHAPGRAGGGSGTARAGGAGARGFGRR